VTSSSTGRLAPSATRRRLLLSSPVGPLLAEYDDEALLRLYYWPQGKHPPAGTRVEPTREDPLGWRIAEQLREYFAGNRREFDLPLRLEGTDFQKQVWTALGTIPFGATVSYAEVGEWVGTRNARAIGQANARNPIPLILACHRVLTAGGGLGGFMGQGPDGEGAQIKRWLLRHEGVPGF
jgi:methylated-DNA-[protein]-cysteine S-methyltransferase